MFFLKFEQINESQTVIEKLESSQADLMKNTEWQNDFALPTAAGMFISHGILAAVS